MRSLIHDSFGEPEDVLRLTEENVPEPSEGQVRIRVSCPPFTTTTSGRSEEPTDSFPTSPHMPERRSSAPSTPSAPTSRVSCPDSGWSVEPPSAHGLSTR